MFGSTLINSNSNNGYYSSGLRIAKAVDNNIATIMLGVPQNSLSGINPNAGEWYITSNPNNNLLISDESSTESTGLVIRGDGNLPTWKGTSLASVNSNVASATKLATARTIALGTGATGTATAFDGTTNVTIPVTTVNATYLLSGTVAPARLSGTYAIGISGKAATAGAADTATSASSATKLSTARSLNVTGAATGTAATFDGTGNVNIAVNSLDPTKLVNVGANNIGVRYDLVSFNAHASSITGAIKITLPPGVVDMLNIEIDVYEYDSHSASKIIIGGYTYGGSHVWYNTSYSVQGRYNKGVRFAYDGTNYCIILGNQSTVWSYPKINVAKITGGYGNTVAMTGAWTSSIITDESALTNITSPTPTAASSATKLATARTISLGTGATGTATAFDGSANITIPVTSLNATYLNSGTVAAARLSGTYAIGISGKAATAGVADTATSANSAATAKNVSGGSVNATTGSFSGAVTTNSNFITNGGSVYFRAPVTTGGWARGINYSSSDGTTTYGGIGMLGSGTAASTFYIGWGSSPHYPTYGLTMGTTGATTLKGSLSVTNGITGTLSGNASTATRLAAARTIALGTGATGTATAFNGTANITIPVTALNAGYLNAGTIPTARLTGKYGIDIGGTAKYAEELSKPISSVAYADTAGTANTATSIAISGWVSAPTDDFNSSAYFNNGFYGTGGNGAQINSPGGSTYGVLETRGRSGSIGNGNCGTQILTNYGDMYIRGYDGTKFTAWSKTVTSNNIASYSAGNVTTPSGTYKHLGAWGVARTAAGAILVNTAYTADRASYADSAGSASGIPVNISAPEETNQYGTAKMLIFPNSKLKIAYGTMTNISAYGEGIHYFPVPFTHAVRAINCNPRRLDRQYLQSAINQSWNPGSWSYMVIGY